MKKEFLPPVNILLNIDFHGKCIGEYYADILVENKIIIELKASDSIHAKHRAQIFNYLKTTDIKLGFLMNFGKKSLVYERFIY